MVVTIQNHYNHYQFILLICSTMERALRLEKPYRDYLNLLRRNCYPVEYFSSYSATAYKKVISL